MSAASWLLAIEGGNSRVALALLPCEPAPGSTPHAPAVAARLNLMIEAGAPEHAPAVTPAALDAWLAATAAPAEVARVIVATVNEAGSAPIVAWARERAFGPLRQCGVDLAVPIDNHTKKPEAVGQDRLLNALAAARRAACHSAGCAADAGTDRADDAGAGRAAIALDIGTAITAEAVDATGAYLGGVIAPGPVLGLRALAAYTERLPRVELPPGLPPPIGADTVSAMQAGVAHGFRGLVAELIAVLSSALAARGHADPLVLATGGDARAIADGLPSITAFVDDLTLEGLWWTAITNANA